MSDAKTLEELGAERYIGYLGVETGDLVVMVYDLKTNDVADLLTTAMKDLGVAPVGFVMEAMEDQRPLTTFPKSVYDAMGKAQATIFIGTSYPEGDELNNFRMPMIGRMKELGLRHGHSPGMSLDLLRMGMNAPVDELDAFTNRVAEIVEESRTCTVTTELGTNLEVEFHPDWHWKKDSGKVVPGIMQNLPCGEVFTTPFRIKGLMVADGSMGDKWGIIEHPITIKIEDSRVVKIACEDSELVEELWEYFKRGENGDRVGEFALATNLWIRRVLIGNLLQDEKADLHIAFGHPYEDDTSCDWKCDSGHLDFLVPDATVIVDNFEGPLIRAGEYAPSLLPDEFR